MNMTPTITPDDLQKQAVLDTIVERRRTADQAEADVLTLAVQYAALHPVTDSDDAAAWVVNQPLTGPPDTLPVTAVGVPAVAEQAVVELGAALGISYRSALSLVADAVELHHRLPRLWDLVQAGRFAAWKARRVAAQTVTLSADVVAFVDRHVSVTARRGHLPKNLPALIHEAIAQCDPDLAEGIEDAKLRERDVRFDHLASTATTCLTAVLDTLDAIDLENRISELATRMLALGDTSPLGVCRAHALGLLAGAQTILDLESERPKGSGATLYLHVDADDLEAGAGAGRVENLGAATLTLLQDWLARVGKVTVRPVLDLGRDDSVDRHDPPALMRETVVLRDGHCVFPGCTIDARRCDLDHMQAYVSPDDGGPPGQTSPANLACLCRRHHRAKTFDGWSYRRTSSTSYEWFSPHGRRLVTHYEPTH
jgi:uncharacterized protein DUF222